MLALPPAGACHWELRPQRGEHWEGVSRRVGKGRVRKEEERKEEDGDLGKEREEEEEGRKKEDLLITGNPLRKAFQAWKEEIKKDKGPLLGLSQCYPSPKMPHFEFRS